MKTGELYWCEWPNKEKVLSTLINLSSEEAEIEYDLEVPGIFNVLTDKRYKKTSPYHREDVRETVPISWLTPFISLNPMLSSIQRKENNEK